VRATDIIVVLRCAMPNKDGGIRGCLPTVLLYITVKNVPVEDLFFGGSAISSEIWPQSPFDRLYSATDQPSTSYFGYYFVEMFSDPAATADGLRHQFTQPSDVFSILLLLGPDVIAQAIAQLAGGILTPVTFSFGWVAYAVSALLSVGGENKLMPLASDGAAVEVINGSSGYTRSNSSWVIGRIIRDYKKWIHRDSRARHRQNRLDKHAADQAKLVRKGQHSEAARLEVPARAGLCIAIYRPSTTSTAGVPNHDLIYYSGFITAIFQLGLAAIPCGIFGDWGILMMTSIGIALAFATGSLPQWRKEKWACREKTSKDVILSRGNGSDHAIVVLGNEHGLDLEDLASGPTNYDASTSNFTRIAVVCLATAWIFLLIAAAGLKGNAWFLLAVGGIGMLQNIAVASFERNPSALGIHLDFVGVVGHYKIMKALFELEERHPGIGANMVPTFFPGQLREDEKEQWDEFATRLSTSLATVAE
jgi:hypothetical protein